MCADRADAGRESTVRYRSCLSSRARSVRYFFFFFFFFFFFYYLKPLGLQIAVVEESFLAFCILFWPTAFIFSSSHRYKTVYITICMSTRHPLGVNIRFALIDNVCCSVLEETNLVKFFPARNPSPVARASPSVTFKRFLSFDLAASQLLCVQTCSRSAAPPAQPMQSKAPQNRFVYIEQDDLTPACLVLECSKSDRGIRECSQVESQPTCGAIEAHRVSFYRGHNFTPVCFADCG